MEPFYQMLEAVTDAIALANHLRVQKFLDGLTAFTKATMEATNQPPSLVDDITQKISKAIA